MSELSIIRAYPGARHWTLLEKREGGACTLSTAPIVFASVETWSDWLDVIRGYHPVCPGWEPEHERPINFHYRETMLLWFSCYYGYRSDCECPFCRARKAEDEYKRSLIE